jgi:hypothetical protein
LADRPQFEARSHEVWPFRGALGFRRSIESAGTVAAPLLAGFSFTLLVLVLPTLGEGETSVRIDQDVALVSDSESFSALPEFAAILFLAAGLLLVGSVQAAIAMRYHGHAPSDFEEWYPEYFREAEHARDAPDPTGLAGWEGEEANPVQVDRRWYGGWPREYLYYELLTANWWARWSRRLYHGGILALLLGLTFLVVPAEGQWGLGRSALLVVAAVGVIAEAAWILAAQYEGELQKLVSSLRRRGGEQGNAREDDHTREMTTGD